MKKLFAFLSLVALLTLGASNQSFAQNDKPAADPAVTTPTTDEGLNATDTVGGDEAKTVEATKEDTEKTTELSAEEAEKNKTFHQVLKRYFIQGGAEFMSLVLLALILGLALCIERIIYLNLATSNTRKLLMGVEDAIKNGGVDAAKEICKDTRGPVASIFYQGLSKYDEGLDNVEKSIVAYGSVSMARLEKGLSWISLFIALAPMLGFMGTVIGMIQAFDKIQEMGDINPTVVAGGIKVALLTTVFGLIVAIILQIFYNYIVAKVDSLVNDMEDSSITFMDILSENKA